jgi:hypothetical protein
MDFIRKAKNWKLMSSYALGGRLRAIVGRFWVRSGDMGNTLWETRGTLQEVPHALENNITHEPKTAIHRGYQPAAVFHH